MGLPNVGKSTLFTALSAKQAEAANYAFCTIEPNVGVVPVPDKRMDGLIRMYAPGKVVPATVNFVDIAGLVRGAAKGEGKGNAFLSHIRDTHALAHVVRCFEDNNIVHVDGQVDPVADIATIETELALRDLDTVQRRLDKSARAAKGGKGPSAQELAILQAMVEALDAGTGVRAIASDSEVGEALARELGLLTAKPSFFVCNVKEEQLAEQAEDVHLQAVRGLAEQRNTPVVVICAAVEAEIMALPAEERGAFLASMGLAEPGLHAVIRTGYAMLDLITFFTAGPKEVHAWTLRRGSSAVDAAGSIHTDFAKQFIRAEVMAADDLLELGGEAAVKAAGKLAVEGRDYAVQDGDILFIRSGA